MSAADADLDRAAAEIDALIAAGDVEATGRWFVANYERHIRARDAVRLFSFIREARP